MDTRALRWLDPPDGPAVALLDQTRLPAEEMYLTCTDVASLVDAIGRLVVRGAPLLGLAGAFGVALAAYRGENVERAAAALAQARPTAVNLAWGAGRALAAYQAAQRAGATVPDTERPAARAALAEARSIAAEDAAASAAIAANGLSLVPDRARILTHCNTGALATGGFGTALGVIRAAFIEGMVERVYADETRPWLQGSRLTAWELANEGIPVTLNADSAAAHIMKTKGVTWVIVGADRITANGDVANKIGTYQLAVNAMHHGVRFMVVAPSSTIDMNLASGDDIPIEERDGAELLEVGGKRVGADVEAFNPVFDVTPADLIDAIVTEKGIVERPDTAKMAQLMCRKRLH